MVGKKYLIFSAIGVAIAVAVVGIYISTAGAPNNPSVGSVINSAENIGAQKTEAQSKRVLDLSGASPARGSPNAPITMVEFGDYQCSNCHRYFKETEHMILKDYVETGKVKIIFVDFPFIGPDSITAAQAAHCADDQGKFWEYHDEVYSNWNGENTGWAITDNLKKFASNIGLDQKIFDQCLDSKKYEQKVKTNFDIGRQLDVSGTPTFFIIYSPGKAVKMVGAQPYPSFAQVLDSKL